MILGAIFLSTQNGSAQDRLTSSVAKEYANSNSARLSRMIASKMGCELEMLYAPFARRLVLMEEGKVDFVAGLYKLPEREVYIHFIDPPYKQGVIRHFFLLKTSPVRIHTYEDLYGLKIGTKIGSKYFKRFDQDPKLHKVQVSTLEQNFEMLLLGRIDAVIYSHGGGTAQVRKMGIEDKVRVSRYYNSEYNPVYVGISRKSPLMNRKDEMEIILRAIIESGKI